MMTMPSIKCGVLQEGSLDLICFEMKKVLTNDSTMSDPVIKWKAYLNTRP